MIVKKNLFNTTVPNHKKLNLHIKCLSVPCHSFSLKLIQGKTKMNENNQETIMKTNKGGNSSQTKKSGL